MSDHNNNNVNNTNVSSVGEGGFGSSSLRRSSRLQTSQQGESSAQGAARGTSDNVIGTSVRSSQSTAFTTGEETRPGYVDGQSYNNLVTGPASPAVLNEDDPTGDFNPRGNRRLVASPRSAFNTTVTGTTGERFTESVAPYTSPSNTATVAHGGTLAYVNMEPVAQEGPRKGMKEKEFSEHPEVWPQTDSVMANTYPEAVKNAKRNLGKAMPNVNNLEIGEIRLIQSMRPSLVEIREIDTSPLTSLVESGRRSYHAFLNDRELRGRLQAYVNMQNDQFKEIVQLGEVMSGLACQLARLNLSDINNKTVISNLIEVLYCTGQTYRLELAGYMLACRESAATKQSLKSQLAVVRKINNERIEAGSNGWSKYETSLSKAFGATKPTSTLGFSSSKAKTTKNTNYQSQNKSSSLGSQTQK